MENLVLTKLHNNDELIKEHGDFIIDLVFKIANYGAKGIKRGSKIVGVNLRFDESSKKMCIDVFADCGIFRRKKRAPVEPCILECEKDDFNRVKDGIVQYLFISGAFENFLNNNFSFTVEGSLAVRKQ